MAFTRRRFQLPGFPPIESTAAKLAIALIACSVVYALARNVVGDWVLLIPEMVLRSFALWQPLSYVFLETTPMGVIFGALITWSIGGALEQSWGRRRLGYFAVGTTILAGVLTVLLALAVSRVRLHAFAGGTVMTSALWVAYGLSYGRRETNFWGMPVTGNVFALIGVGFVFLTGAFYDWFAVVPSAFGILLTWGYLRGASPSHLLLRFNSWRLQRRLKGRARHLRVIGKDRNMPKDSDRFLH